MIYRKITLPCSKHSAVWNFFYNLTLYFQLFTIKTWFISAPNINQSTFGIDLPAKLLIFHRNFLHLQGWVFMNHQLKIIRFFRYNNKLIYFSLVKFRFSFPMCDFHNSLLLL